MSLAVENLEHSMAKLTITVPAEEFGKAMTTAYNKQKGKFNVPGFRTVSYTHLRAHET